MGRQGITNVLPLTGGQGITVTGNKINLGGKITAPVTIIASDYITLKDPNEPTIFNNIGVAGFGLVNPLANLVLNINVDFIEIINQLTGKSMLIGYNANGNDEMGINVTNAAIGASILNVTGNGLSGGIENGSVSTNGIALTVNPVVEDPAIDLNSSLPIIVNGLTYRIPVQSL